MRFQPDFIEKVVEANDLVDIISQYTQLKNAGSNLMGLCPFPSHKEKTPSFSVSRDKQLYHCFGCKKGGNAIHFLQDYNGYSFVEAIEYLANRASIPIPENEMPSKEMDQARQHRQNLEKLNKLAFQHFQQSYQQLPDKHMAKVYLKERGLKPETIEAFHIGYAKDSWDALVHVLAKQKQALPLAQELGLIKRKKDGSSYFDIFRNRIIFPILSPMGKVLGFGGRVLAKEDQPKYLNSPESAIYHKGKTLYGLNETAKYLRSEDQAILVEGYMDLIALYQVGIKNVVAGCGTAFTLEQAKLIKKYTQNVVLLFDGDKSGQEAMRRALPTLLEAGLYPKGFSLPEGQDPDDFIRANGVQALQERIDKSEDLFLWFLQSCLKSFQGKPSDKLKILDLSFPILAKISDFRLLSLYFGEMAYRLDEEKAWIERSFRDFVRNKSTFTRPQSPKYSPQKEEKPSDNNRIDVEALLAEEIELVNLVLSEEYLLKQSLDLNLHSKFVTVEGREILRWIEKRYRQDPAAFATLGNSVLTTFGHSGVLTKHLNSGVYSDEDKNKKLFDLCIQKLEKVQLKQKLSQIKAQMKSQTSKDSLENLREIIQATRAKRHEEITE